MARQTQRGFSRAARALAVVCVLGAWRAVPAFAQASPAPTLRPAVVRPAACPPGKAFKVTFRWDAVPMAQACTVFVHFLDAKGVTVFQDDHDPDVPTTKWAGPVRYTRNVFVPADVPDGTYRIQAGLYRHTQEAPGWKNYSLTIGGGVTADDADHYTVGRIKISRQAPSPPLDSDRPVTLNLKGYHQTFNEDFHDLSVSADGPGTRWTAHTPYHGDFGDAGFGNPGPDSPFSVAGGILRIRAAKVGGKWRAGLLCSVDPHGAGFSQKYGYFEMRARFPKGAGTWPAFWLNDATNLTDRSQTGMEIDVVEQYGLATQALHSTMHWWRPGGKHEAVATTAFVADMTEGFHNYGLLWTKENVVWYFDGVEIFRRPTPPELQSHAEYLLVNLALGGGWPIDKTPDPSDMWVQHVRAYAKG